MITTIWTELKEMWKARNADRHGVDSEHKKRRQQEEAFRELDLIYADKDSYLDHVQELMWPTAKEHKQESLQNVLQWLNTHRSLFKMLQSAWATAIPTNFFEPQDTGYESEEDWSDLSHISDADSISSDEFGDILDDTDPTASLPVLEMAAAMGVEPATLHTAMQPIPGQNTIHSRHRRAQRQEENMHSFWEWHQHRMVQRTTAVPNDQLIPPTGNRKRTTGAPRRQGTEEAPD